MKQILVELPEPLARRLEAVAPSRERKRAAFIRQAIARAIDEVQERQTEEAYRKLPQGDGAEWFDAGAWDPWKQGEPRKPRRSKLR